MATIIKCKRGKGDREAPEINDALVVATSIAIGRGQGTGGDPSIYLD